MNCGHVLVTPPNEAEKAARELRAMARKAALSFVIRLGALAALALVLGQCR